MKNNTGTTTQNHGQKKLALRETPFPRTYEGNLRTALSYNEHITPATRSGRSRRRRLLFRSASFSLGKKEGEGEGGGSWKEGGRREGLRSWELLGEGISCKSQAAARGGGEPSAIVDC